MNSRDMPATVVTAEPFPEDDIENERNGSSSSSSQLPIVELSLRQSADHAVAQTLENQNGRNFPPTILTASQLPTSMRDEDIDGFATRLSPYRQCRAEYVSANFLKSTQHTFWGLQLGSGNDKRITNIAPDGPVSTSPIRIGDELLSINQKDISKLRSVEVYRLLKECTGSVTLVAHTPDGIPASNESN